MILEVVSRYYSLLEEDAHHRYKSWEHCYSFFKENYKNMTNPEILDYGCLHLGLYLANWGMLRKSFLRHKDYRVHEYLIQEVVQNPAHHKYYEPKLLQDLEAADYEEIDEMISSVKKAYTKHIHMINGIQQEVAVTDALASKILLGIYGNTPAYDSYFKEGLKLYGIDTNFSKKSILELITFYHKNEEEFKSCRMINELYTPMKWVDMYFWQIGLILSQKDRDEALVKQLMAAAKQYKESMNNNGSK